MRPTADFVCIRCGEPKERQTYATDEHGFRLCDPCAHAVTVAEMSDAHTLGRPFVAYTSCDGEWLTGWAGDQLGTIVARGWTSHPWTRDRTHVHVRDLSGDWWHGWSARGMYMTLRPMKAPNYSVSTVDS